MTEEELMHIGFFKIEPNLPNMRKADIRLKLFENYKGVFLRLIVSNYNDTFVIDHIYFDSPESNKLQFEFFGDDLSLENIVSRIKAYRESDAPSNDGPETF